MGAWPVLLSALGKPVTLAALEILVLTVQKLGATHNHTRGWLPATGSCAVPGSPPNKGLSTHTAAAGCRIVCQPSLINTTFSIQVLGLSRGLRCPGKTRKLLISRTGSVISEFSWIQMCQLQPSPLELLGAGRSAMHHFFFLSAWQLKWQKGLWSPSSASGTRELCDFAKGVTELRQRRGKMAKSCAQSPEPQSIWGARHSQIYSTWRYLSLIQLYTEWISHLIKQHNPPNYFSHLSPNPLFPYAPG